MTLLRSCHFDSIVLALSPTRQLLLRSCRVAVLIGFACARRRQQGLEPLRGLLESAGEVIFVVYICDAEPFVVSIGPLKVVHEGPRNVPCYSAASAYSQTLPTQYAIEKPVMLDVHEHEKVYCM